MSTDRPQQTEKSLPASLVSLCRRGALGAYDTLLLPRSINEDSRRKERVLTVILFCINIFLLLLESSLITERVRYGADNPGITIIPFTIFLVAFLWLYYICRIGHFKLAAYLFIATYFLLTLYGSIRFGASMPAGLLSYVLAIVMASIVISSRFGLIIAGSSIAAIVTVGLYEHAHGTLPDWRMMPVQVNDLVQYSVFFLLLATVSWLSNSEIERSLTRA